MSRWAGLVFAACLLAGAAFGGSPVALTIGPEAATTAIPEDFSGLSFETMVVLADAHGGHFFSQTNTPIIALFKTLGARNLRIGGNTADLPADAIPTHADIDNLFAFAKDAGVKVIYTLRLRHGDVTNDIEIARYIEQRYKPQLAYFAIGNEPDYYRKVYPVIKNYSDYRKEWKKYAAAVAAAVPGARFLGPSAGAATAWARDFANDFAKSGLVELIAQHDYPAGQGRRATNAAAARDLLLSPVLLDHYGKYYNDFATTAVSNGLPYRFEEANNFSDGGVKDASDTFASALWSLDYMHWWAEHGANGINFHGRRWVPNCVIYPVAGDKYNVRPIGYGIKAFALGGHGTIVPMKIENADALNLTAYAVRDGHDLFVTIINKEHGPGARAADVSIAATPRPKESSVIFLAAPDVAAKTGVTLGGESIQDGGAWAGKWTPLKPDSGPVKVPPATAAILRRTRAIPQKL